MLASGWEGVCRAREVGPRCLLCGLCLGGRAPQAARSSPALWDLGGSLPPCWLPHHCPHRTLPRPLLGRGPSPGLEPGCSVFLTPMLGGLEPHPVGRSATLQTISRHFFFLKSTFQPCPHLASRLPLPPSGTSGEPEPNRSWKLKPLLPLPP